MVRLIFLPQVPIIPLGENKQNKQNSGVLISSAAQYIHTETARKMQLMQNPRSYYYTCQIQNL